MCNIEKLCEKIKNCIDIKISELKKLQEEITIKCVDSLEISNVKKDFSIPAYLKNYNNKSILYIIKINKLPNGYKENFERIKKDKKIAMPRINNQSNDNYLYLGSSHNIYKRLNEHIGNGAEKTYALHLKKWWGDEKIIIELYEILANNKNSLQIIEDILWETYKPLLGKQGKR